MITIIRKSLAIVLGVCSKPYVKFAAISTCGIVLVGFVGDNSIYAHLRHRHTISTLASEIAVYTDRYQSDMRQLNELNHNPRAIEHIARQRYFMKHADEDIFVLSDDPRATTLTTHPSPQQADETAQ